jgi:phage major head subunit gpT-like protein
MGRAAQQFPDELIFRLLKSGASTVCYDGQFFFNTDHPVYSDTDVVTSVSNINTSGAGGNPYWYLLDCSRALRPLIFQNRQPPDLVAMDNSSDEVVFMKNVFRYGVDMRCNVGFGFWQMAYASNQTLNTANYAAARAAMRAFDADGGRPLGIVPNVLVVPPALEGAGRALLVKDANGGNEWAGTAELLASEWLA